MQNSLTFGGPITVHTTIITGNFQKIGIACFRLIISGGGRNCLKEIKVIWKPITAILLTGCGAMAGSAYFYRALDKDPHYGLMPVAGLQLTFFVLHDIFFRDSTKAE